MSEIFDWYVGIDWASEVHQVCLVDDRGVVRGERAVRHGGEELAALAAWLIEATGAAPERIAIGIELPHGPVVESLMERGFAVHALNPKQLDRFRDRFSVSGAKDDRRDAWVLGDSLRTDTRCFRRLKPDEPWLIELREQLRMAEEGKHDRVRLTNRMREQLWRYYPQILELSDDLSAAWFLDLWALAPTPAKALRVRESTIAKLLKKHRVRRFDAAEVVRRLRRPALTVAPGTVEAASAHVGALRDRLRLVTRQISASERRIDQILIELATSPEDPEAALGQPPQQSDVTILRSLPGVGRIVCATLLVEAGGALKAGDHQALRALWRR
jgi:Transposase